MAIDPDIIPLLDEINAKINNIPGGPQGATGPQGQTGPQGPSGTPGKDLSVEYTALAKRVAAIEVKLGATGATGATGPSGPVSKNGPFFGYTWAAGPLSGVDAVVAKGLKKPKILRMFTGNNSPSGLNEKDLVRTDCAKWVSWKPHPVNQMPNPGSWAPQAVANLKSRVPKGVPVFMTVWHEPEGDDSRQGRPVSEWIKIWQNAQAALYDECVKARAEGHKFWVAPVICDWTFTDKSKGAAEAWYSADFTKYDVMGWDVYPVGQKADGKNTIARLAMDADYKPKPYADPARRDAYQYITKIAELAKQRNKPWGSGECGIIAGKERGGDSLYKYTLEQRANRFLDIRAHLISLENPPLLWSWWHHDSCNVTSQNPVDTHGIAAFNLSIDNSPAGLPTL